MENKYIGLVTSGVQFLCEEDGELVGLINRAFAEEVKNRNDYFYELTVKNMRFWAVDNGEVGYTVMLPSEY